VLVRVRGPGLTRLERSTFLVLGKFPEACGVVKFLAHRVSGTSGALIEYK
jgi:hypothetical protein